MSLAQIAAEVRAALASARERADADPLFAGAMQALYWVHLRLLDEQRAVSASVAATALHKLGQQFEQFPVLRGPSWEEIEGWLRDDAVMAGVAMRLAGALRQDAVTKELLHARVKSAQHKGVSIGVHEFGEHALLVTVQTAQMPQQLRFTLPLGTARHPPAGEHGRHAPKGPAQEVERRTDADVHGAQHSRGAQEGTP